MINNDNIIPIGYIYKPHGYKGDINVELFYDKELIKNYDGPLFLKIDNIPVPFFIENKREGNSKNWFIKLKNIDSDIEVSKLIKKDIYLEKKELAKILDMTESEIDLEVSGFKDYKVITSQDNQQIGTVVDIEEAKEYDYIIVKRKDNSSLLQIPLIDEFIEEILPPTGKNGGKIIVSLPEGYLEI